MLAEHAVAIVWLRRALRLADNPALEAALASSRAVVPVYILEVADGDAWLTGAASRAWLAQSLAALHTSLLAHGSALVVRSGPALEALGTLAAECGATAVHFDARFEPGHAAADQLTSEALAAAGLDVRSHNCSLLNDPSVPLTTSGGPYKVFTPYYNACLRLSPPDPPLPVPAAITSPGVLPAGLGPAAIISLLDPAPSASGPTALLRYFTPGEAGALATAGRFFAEALSAYPEDRDRPDVFGTSRLSPHLAFGEVGPRQLHAAARAATGLGRSGPASDGAASFVRQLYWREFAHHVLHHFPHTATLPMRAEFGRFPWQEDSLGLEAWRSGHTGFPIVDAGMRELAVTGWMHNRVRMIAASVLTKDLLVPWQEGAHFFWDQLVDANLANNSFGWQWVAGSGADATPYFRVFNPALQGAKFDPTGAYVRTWVPELAALPQRWIHRPHEAPPSVLAEAGVKLGETYPEPIVPHAEARLRALAAYDALLGLRRNSL